MGANINSDESLILKAIDEILWYDWDPLGVNDFPDARDEYSSYVLRIYDLKKSNAVTEIIGNELHKIETSAMGVFRDAKRCNEIAIKIFQL